MLTRVIVITLLAPALLAAGPARAQDSSGDPAATTPPPPVSTVALAPGSEVGIDPTRNVVHVGSPVAILNSCDQPVCTTEGGEPFQVSGSWTTSRPVDLLRVPAGKVAVVKHVSARARSDVLFAVRNNNLFPAPAPLAGAELTTFLGLSQLPPSGVTHYLAWTIQGYGGSPAGGGQGLYISSVAAESLLFYARAGTTISFRATPGFFELTPRNFVAAESSGEVTISGVLVNAH